MKKVWAVAVMVVGLVGGVMAADEIPASFSAKYQDVAVVKQKLANAGLQVLGTHRVAGDKDYTVVVYTSDGLKKAAGKSDCGFAAVMRVLVDSKDKKLMASNPEYYLRAFLRGNYKKGMGDAEKKALEKALGELKDGKVGLSAKKLKKYHFMMGMPYYDDFQVVGEGSTESLLKKLHENAKGRIVFEQKIKDDGSVVLCGVALPKKIEKFNEKIGTMDRSQLLPYCVLIGSGKARILHAKFYLAVSFPDLTMGQFMKIRSIPGKIEDAFEAIFK